MSVSIRILAGDQNLIPYRRKLNQLTGSVTATILLQQVMYWHEKSNGKPFYKFKQVCNHKLYKEGDSWCEELGFSRSEFDTALSKIGTKITTGDSKVDAYKEVKRESLVIYWTDSSRMTWYSLNQNLLGKAINLLYLEKQDFDFSKIKLDSDFIFNHETTSETTTKPESSTDDTLPVTFQQWCTRISQASNRVAELMLMFTTLYPNNSTPSYSYLGKVAKQLHGQRLADLLWQHSTRPPTGDVLAYIQKIAKNGSGRTQQPQQQTVDNGMTPEQALQQARAKVRL